MLNLIAIVGYWGLVHAVEINNKQGIVRFHMYVVHINPTVAYYLNYRVTHFELCQEHWRLFVPLGIIYATLNYLET